MKQHYTNSGARYGLIRGKALDLRISLFVLFFVFVSSFYSQQTYSFTNAGATGRLGPTQLQVTNSYTNTNLAGNVTVVGNGIQQWVVPGGGNYRITVAGAKGGDGRNGTTATPGGAGAIVKAELNLTGGQTLQIVCGQVGLSSTVTSDTGGGGGGGSFVSSGGTPLIIAGGGGSGADNNVGGTTGTTSTSGLQGNATGGVGGTGGNGGAGFGTIGSGGGGGYTTNGTTAAGGLAFLNGAEGGPGTYGDGGFGGGGGGNDATSDNGAGGGGYSGGGGGGSNAAGGGGGSFIESAAVNMASSDGFYNGATVQNLATFNSGHGYVLIEELCSITLSVAGLNSSGAMCTGNSVTITTNAISNHSWTPGNLTPYLVVSPTTNTVYGLTAMSPSNCMATSHVSITITPLPNLNVNTNSPIVCLGNPAVINMGGADTYTWNTSSTANSITVTPIQKTTYFVTGTNTVTNCSLTRTVSVDVFTPTVSIIGNNTICKGVTTTLTAIANGAISYSWSTGLPIQSILVAPASHTIYVASVVVSTLNITCTGINSVQVTVNPNPNIVPIANRLNMCINENVVFSATGGTAYAWSWGSQTSTGSTVSITPLVMTNMIMNVTGTGTNGCTNTGSVSVLVNACTGIKETNPIGNTIQVYPNPSQGEVNITFGAPVEFLLINQTGQLIQKLSLTEENDYKVNISGLSSGIYFVTGQSGNSVIKEKIVISR